MTARIQFSENSQLSRPIIISSIIIIIFPLQRLALYNSLATSLMCQAGLEVLDVYPFTRSFPEGTGGPEVAWYKERDIVHFKFHVMKPIEHFLEEYFLGKIARPINFVNYMFS